MIPVYVFSFLWLGCSRVGMLLNLDRLITNKGVLKMHTETVFFSAQKNKKNKSAATSNPLTGE